MSRKDVYADKRSFDRTPEPPAEVRGDVDPTVAPVGSTFVIHQHHARRLHFDLRLEMMNGATPVLVSWAIPKNLPRKKGKPHLAVHVEDHPFDYGSFSGTIPAGNYGAGEVRIFDDGEYEMLERAPGKLTFRLRGHRLQGVYHLVQTKKDEGKDEWLAFLRADERPEPEDPPQAVPMLATLAREPFDDDGWLFELKWDGIRALALCGETTTLMSRSGRDITSAYPELEKLHDRLVAIDAIVDGEIVALDGDRPSFERLQGRMNLQNAQAIARASKEIPVTYIAFDILYLDGRRTIGLPLEERRALLDELVVTSDLVQVSPAGEGMGTSLFELAQARNLEGIVAKKKGCPYRPGRRVRDWLKIKTTFDADVVVGGWSRGEGAREASFGALLVGAFSERGLEFAGSVGTGFSEKTIAQLLPELHEREADECPFVRDPSGTRSSPFGKPLRGVRWVRPELVASVEFRELTSQGRLRAPSFKGLRPDVDPRDCRIEALRPAPPP